MGSKLHVDRLRHIGAEPETLIQPLCVSRQERDAPQLLEVRMCDDHLDHPGSKPAPSSVLRDDDVREIRISCEIRHDTREGELPVIVCEIDDRKAYRVLDGALELVAPHVATPV